MSIIYKGALILLHSFSSDCCCCICLFSSSSHSSINHQYILYIYIIVHDTGQFLDQKCQLTIYIYIDNFCHLICIENTGELFMNILIMRIDFVLMEYIQLQTLSFNNHTTHCSLDLLVGKKPEREKKSFSCLTNYCCSINMLCMKKRMSECRSLPQFPIMYKQKKTSQYLFIYCALSLPMSTRTRNQLITTMIVLPCNIRLFLFFSLSDSCQVYYQYHRNALTRTCSFETNSTGTLNSCIINHNIIRTFVD